MHADYFQEFLAIMLKQCQNKRRLNLLQLQGGRKQFRGNMLPFHLPVSKDLAESIKLSCSGYLEASIGYVRQVLLS
jgi:hypothetical protein